MEFINRIDLAELIYNKIVINKDNLTKQFNDSKNTIAYVFLDDVLPAEIAQKMFDVFPTKEQMVLKSSLRQNKYVGVQMNKYNPLLEEITYAFQEKKVVDLIGEICEIDTPIPDKFLYAGGLSMMGKNQFLNPHLDNSHDKDRALWRVLNLLYYVTPNWNEEYGGNLELWPQGLNNSQVTIHSKFNRLAIMITHNRSMHSVSEVVYDGYRCCISNYYFAEKPVLSSDTFHVTSFRGRPENKLTDLVLKVDTYLRMNIRKIFKKGITENPQVYKPKN